jgi:signal peptidase II
MKKVFKIAFICILIDQVIKNILMFCLSFGQSISIIKNFFSITLIGNTGAAFSILSSSTILLILISIIVLNLIYFYLIKGKDLKKQENIYYGLLIGGIMGNLIDRIIHFKVIDYLDFSFFNMNFPIFNFADMCIVVSMILIAVEIIKGDKDEVSSKRK